MLLSKLLPKISDNTEYSIYKEKSFDVLGRITTQTDGKACVYLEDKKYVKQILNNVSMIITTECMGKQLIEECNEDMGVCICENPKTLYFKILNFISDSEEELVESTIGRNCRVSEHAYIAPCGVKIEDNVCIEEFASVYEGTTIGEGSVIHAGAKIGIQDFNFYRDGKKVCHVNHRGRVLLGKGVEIGFNTVIGRGLYSYGSTSIGNYTKIACNSSIGHDVKMGKNVMINSNVAIGGHVKIEDNASIALSVGIKNTLFIGEDSKVQMGSSVIRSVPDKAVVFGNPAKPLLTPKT